MNWLGDSNFPAQISGLLYAQFYESLPTPVRAFPHSPGSFLCTVNGGVKANLPPIAEAFAAARLEVRTTPSVAN